MKKIICRIIELVYPDVKRTVAEARAKRTARNEAMQAMLFASHELRTNGYGVDAANELLQPALMQYRHERYAECTSAARTAWRTALGA